MSTKSTLVERIPIQLSVERVHLYGFALIVLGLVPLVLAPNSFGCHWCWSRLWEANWANFYAGGATAGTQDLLDVYRHGAWQQAHGFVPQPFVYPPGVAIAFMPFVYLPLAFGFWANALVMLAACIDSALIAARIYRVDVKFAILAVLAWTPATASIAEGTNASLALLLTLLCAFGLVKGRWWLTGIAVGLLLYKPSDAVFFVILLLVRRQWRALGVVAVCAAGWYLAGFFATGNDAAWPAHYAALLRWYYPVEFAHYGKWAIGSIGLLLHLGIPQTVATPSALAIGIAGCVALARVSMLEAVSMTGMLAIATSAHALPYEAALLVPALFYVMTHVSEPLRTRIIVIAYATAGLSILRWRIDFDPISIVVVAAAVAWILYRSRFARNTMAAAH